MIFISYQRNDDSVTPKLVRDALTKHIRLQAAAFLDVDSIPPGHAFVDVIHEALDRCTTVLAMIGPRWDPSRLAAADDFVRLELLTAHKLDKLIVPVLHGGRTMPTAGELPAELQFLTRLNAYFLGRTATLVDDIARLASDARDWVPRLPLWQIAQGDFARSATLDFDEPWRIPWLFTDQPLQPTN